MLLKLNECWLSDFGQSSVHEPLWQQACGLRLRCKFAVSDCSLIAVVIGRKKWGSRGDRRRAYGGMYADYEAASARLPLWRPARKDRSYPHKTLSYATRSEPCVHAGSGRCLSGNSREPARRL